MPAVVKFNGQDYGALYRQHIHNREKFTDPTFPPNSKSIDSSSSASDIEWRRPTELVSDPHLVVNGIRGSDVMPGERGNAWFVTATAALTTRTYLLNSVLPNCSVQDYGRTNFHPGIFLFVFCRHGDLYEVVVDDLLPTRRGRLVYSQSVEQNEFWSALLEKAYAKLHGDYASLKRGRVVDAVASFVRGIPEHWDMEKLRAEVNLDSAEEQAHLTKQFQVYLGRQSLLLFSLQPNNTTTRMGDWTKEGLVHGRGYILNEIQNVRLTDEKTTVTLLKFQNAWFDLEWTGAWSDKSPEWKTVSLDYRDRINYRAKMDGIFWMSLQDALKHFTDLDICVVTTAGSRPWLTHTFHGEWSTRNGSSTSRPSARGAGKKRQRVEHDTSPNAGGSYEYVDTYASNPQYLLRVNGDSSVTVSFCLEQGDPSTACYAETQLEIGMDVFSVEINRKCRVKETPREAWAFTRVRASRQPSVLLRSTFPPGFYLVVPCTKDPGQEQTYTLRAFSQSKCSIELLPEFVPRPSGCCSSCQWNPKAVTRLMVTKVTGVNSHLKNSDLTVSVRIDCEASDLTNCQSRYYSEDKQEKDAFTMDFKVLLFRHQLRDPIDVEVYCESKISLLKQFVGAARIVDRGCDAETVKTSPLFRNSKELPVKIHCVVQSASDLSYF